MPTWFRYLLFQIPGWILAAIILFGLYHLQFLQGWLVILCFLAWLVKDVIVYPLTRKAYETRRTDGSQALIGQRGVSEGNLVPEGYVRVRGELWRAVADSAGGNIAAGTKVEITGAEGMTVFVRAVDESHSRRVPDRA